MSGFEGGEVTLLNTDDLVASTEGLQPVTIMVSNTARDSGHPEATTHLRKGLLLTKATSGGEADKYVQFDSSAMDGTQNEETAVVLAHELRDMDDGDKVAVGYFAGTFWSDAVIDLDGSFAFGDVQRIRRRTRS